MRKLKHITIAFVVGLLLAPLALAQSTDPDLRLIADQVGQPPNIMILFDTSGSMRHILWHEDFNPRKAYDASGLGCNNINGFGARSGTDGQCPGSGLTNDRCPDNDEQVTSGQSNAQISCDEENFPGGCAAFDLSPYNFQGGNCTTQPDQECVCDEPLTFGVCFGTIVCTDLPGPGTITFTLPDIAGDSYETWWSKNYVSYIMTEMAANGALPALEDESRTEGGKRVIEELVNTINEDLPGGGYEEVVRFGLARFDSRSNGGYVVEPIAPNNKTSLITSLQNLPANGGTPLSEAYIDIARYFIGDYDRLGTYPVYERTTSGAFDASSAPGSPIDPASAGCQGNFIIVITDGVPTNDNNDYYGSAFSNTFGSDYDNDGNSASDDALDDVALYLFENDLIKDSQIIDDQNIITYVIGYSLDIKVLDDAAINGDGSYFSVANANDLAATLATTVQEIILRNASFTAATVPTTRLVENDSVYTSFFEPQKAGDLYQGHLLAYKLDANLQLVGTDGLSPLDPVTGEFKEPQDTYFWDAGEELLDALNLPRNLYTTKSGVKTDFDDTNIGVTELGIVAADLAEDYPNDTLDPLTTEANLAARIVNYVRGEDSFDEDNDGDFTELKSDTVLGDVFHSNPVLVGPVVPTLSGERGFGPITDPTSYLSLYDQRDRFLVAGANDGVLHAFDAGSYVAAGEPYSIGTGVERWGWIPEFLHPTLKLMMQRGPKIFYMDGPITSADAWIGSSFSDRVKDASEWTTTLVAAARNGADGYIALDITDPNSADFPDLIWEFADATEPLGASWSRPIVTRVKLKTGLSPITDPDSGDLRGDFCGEENGEGGPGLPALGDCREEWVVIFGGGYREQGDPNSGNFLIDPSDAAFDTDSRAIFMVSLRTGDVLAKVAFDSADSELQNMLYSLPSEPAVLDSDFDGFADVIYIGDTGGQMWKWDISAPGEIDASTNLVPTSVWPVGRFFVAPIASNGHYRNIFYPASASIVAGKLTLAFGTGERTDIDYETDGTDLNQFYVIRDDTPTGTGAFTGLPYTISDLDLLSGNGVDTDKTNQGYYFEAEANEKFITDPLTFKGLVAVAAYTPDVSGTGPPCEARGDATLYLFSVADGSGFFYDANADGVADDGTGKAGAGGSRRYVVGRGLPSSPRVVRGKTKSFIRIQTSNQVTGDFAEREETQSPVDVIFWRQVN